jgi:hypothetical protein
MHCRNTAIKRMFARLQTAAPTDFEMRGGGFAGE